VTTTSTITRRGNDHAYDETTARFLDGCSRPRGSGSVSAAEMTITGTIGDALCGRMHKMEGSAEACTRECAKHGEYALISKDTVYPVKGNGAM
jgi:hypothetical protein